MINFFRSPDCNLTIRYYIDVIIRCLKHYRYRHEQSIFSNISNEKQFLEVLLTLMAKCFKGTSSYPREWLDKIMEEVEIRIKNKYPSHSMFCSSRFPEKFSFSEVNDIDEDLWNETEAMQIMSVLEEYLFSELEIHKFLQEFTKELFRINPENKYSCVSYNNICVENSNSYALLYAIRD